MLHSRGSTAWRGASRLEVTLTHPHLLPEPSLGWKIGIELERGQFREIVPEVEALGGAVAVAAEESAERPLRRTSWWDRFRETGI